jgi:hypothetical protein
LIDLTPLSTPIKAPPSRSIVRPGASREQARLAIGERNLGELRAGEARLVVARAVSSGAALTGFAPCRILRAPWL